MIKRDYSSGEYVVTCDKPGCDGNETFDAGGDFKEAIALMKAAGWKTTKTEDDKFAHYCTQCASTMHRPRPPYKPRGQAEEAQTVAKPTKFVIEQACPKCGGDMKWRTSKFGGFYGCAKYPKCNGILKQWQADKILKQDASQQRKTETKQERDSQDW